MEWLKNLSNAIAYIERNLKEDISYEEAARIAGCSSHYFQRMFTYVAGISLAEYIRRRRMSQAAFDLQMSDKKVIDVALDYGYQSPTAFHRAFQAVHGIPPTAAKRYGSALTSYPPITFSVEVTGGSAMSYYIVEKEAMRIVGTRTPLVENMEENHRQVPKFWIQTLQSPIFSTICALSKQEDHSVLGVSVYEGVDQFFYYIAVPCDEAIPEGCHAYEIPAATWVVFQNDGLFKESVQRVFQRFYSEWLLCSGYEYAGLPDIEVYPIEEGTTITGNTEVWIAIKKAKGE